MVAINEKLIPGAGPQNLRAGDYYLLQDTLYRAAALTDSSGNVVEAYDCDAYGNTLIFTGPGADGIWFTDDDAQSNFGANEIIYCGYPLDPETENYYVRNRYYSPVLGRWLQRDPIGYAGGINFYEYVASDPAGNVDPWGESFWGWVGTGAAVGGLIAVQLVPGVDIVVDVGGTITVTGIGATAGGVGAGAVIGGTAGALAYRASVTNPLEGRPGSSLPSKGGGQMDRSAGIEGTGKGQFVTMMIRVMPRLIMISDTITPIRKPGQKAVILMRMIG